MEKKKWHDFKEFFEGEEAYKRPNSVEEGKNPWEGTSIRVIKQNNSIEDVTFDKKLSKLQDFILKKFHCAKKSTNENVFERARSPLSYSHFTADHY